MGRRTRPSFTLVELLASAVILSTLAVMGVPYAQTAKDRQVEIELRLSLWKLRKALQDYAYNEYPMASAYPASIDADGVRGEDPAGDPDGDGIFDDDWDGQVDEDGAPLYPVRLEDLVTKGYLANIPRDPLSEDPSQPATWTLEFVTRQFAQSPSSGTAPVIWRGIVNVRSTNRGISLAGIPYKSW